MRFIRLTLIVCFFGAFAPSNASAQEVPPFYEETVSCSSTAVGIGFINVETEEEFGKVSDGIDVTCLQWPETVERDTQIQRISVTCGNTEISILVMATLKATPSNASEVYFTFVTSCWLPSQSTSDQQANVISNNTLCGTLRYQVTVISEGDVPKEMITPFFLVCQAKPNGFSPEG